MGVFIIVRDAINKSWALGDEPSTEQVSNTLSRRAKPSRQDGDKSARAFKSPKIK
ncbi:MAG: hypothetical protein ACJAYV_002417 [Oleispira sp.]|jgi:hypothetical protein